MAIIDVTEKMPSRLTFWAILGGLIALGLALVSLPDSAHLLPSWSWLAWLMDQKWLTDLLNKLGDAAIIAAILAGAVDWYVKQKLVAEVAKEAVDFAVGYALPPEVKWHIRSLLRNPFLRKDLCFTYEFGAVSGENANDYLAVTCTASYLIQNLTERDIKFNVRTAVQRAHYPALPENKLCRLQIANETWEESQLAALAATQAAEAQAEGRADKLYTSVTREADIPSGESGLQVVTKRLSYHRKDDDIFLDLLPPPSLGLTLKVKGLNDSDYVVAASFGASESVLTEHTQNTGEWTWTVQTVVLPGSHLYLAWHPPRPD